jgi:hypothetical protein
LGAERLDVEGWAQKAGCKKLDAERPDVEGWSQKAGCKRLKAEMNRCKSGWRFMM